MSCHGKEYNIGGSLQVSTLVDSNGGQLTTVSCSFKF
jgi:hypothetical protein